MNKPFVLQCGLASAAVMLLLSFSLLSGAVFAEIRVKDDAGRSIMLAAPARRIVSLAPYLTELLYAAGAGEAIVGVSAYSDYPPAAREIERIGSGAGLDLERILALQPDLVVAWRSGNPAGRLAQLGTLGLPVFLSEPRTLTDIETTLSRLGALAGTQLQAEATRQAFAQRLTGLRQRYAGKPAVSVFYQVWDQPLMTISEDHVISDVIRLCGGRNVFVGLTGMAPQIGIEAVLQRDPQVIIAATDSGNAAALQHWRRWSALQAVQYGQLFTIPGDLLVRHTPRILNGAERLCTILDQVRKAEL